MSGMDLSLAGVDFIKSVEGFELHTYNDSAGYLTVGVGHLVTHTEIAAGVIVIDGQPVNFHNGLTEPQVNSLLMQDAKHAIDAVNQHVTVGLNQQQFDALVSFTFNVGVGAFEDSTLLKFLNAGNTTAAAAQFGQWIRAGGKVVQGLVNRRERERKLFVEGIYEANS